MEQVIILLLVFINVSIIVITSVSKDKWRIRCQQLKDYIRFLESANTIEDEKDGGNWLNERAERRADCDIQDINYE